MNSTVRNLFPAEPTPAEIAHVEHDGGGGDNGGMDRFEHLEKRVDRIDDRLGRIEGDVAAVKTTLASIDAKLDIKSIQVDVAKSHTDIYKWILTVISLVAAIYFGLQRAPTVVAQYSGPSTQITSAAPTRAAPNVFDQFDPKPVVPAAK